MTPRTPFRMTPWVRRFLIANVAVFFLQQTVFTSAGFVQTFGFSASRIFSQPWTLATYMFLHGDLLHLAFNMLLLFMFGAAVEDRMGSRAFAAYYLVSGLGGAVLSLGLLLMGMPSVPVIGASGAIYGIAFAFAWFWPDAPIYVFPLPVPIPAKWLVAFMVTLSLVAQLFGAADGVAHLAHLGGFLFGFAFLKLRGSSGERTMTSLRRLAPTKVLVHPTARRHRAQARSHREPPSQPTDTQAEVDRVLDKISAEGIESLTPQERQLLMDVSERMRTRHQH